MRVFSEGRTIQELSDIALPCAVTGDLSCLEGETAASCEAPLTEHCWPKALPSRINAPGAMPWDSKTAEPVDEADRCPLICHTRTIQNLR